MRSTIDRLQSLFRAACDRPPAEWSGILAQRCDDALLRERAVALLGVDAASRPVSAVGRYLLREVLGSGGMGTVHRARDPVLGRDVALKLLDGTIASEAARRRFAAEATALGRLRHPGIATVHDAGIVELPHGPRAYIAMELIDGVPITEFADAHRLDRAGRLALVAEVADALEHAHRRGVIHRDLKPHNVLVGGDPDAPRVVVVDFGVARVVGADLPLDGEGRIVGTLRYMSPEQSTGDGMRIDRRADIYSLGVLACELLTGEVPVELGGESLLDDLRHVAAGPARSPRELDPSLPPDIERVLLRAMSVEPSRRHASAAEFADDLRRAAAARPDRLPPRRPARVGTAVALALCALLAAARPLGTSGQDAAPSTAAPPSVAMTGAKGTAPPLDELYQRGADEVRREIDRLRALLGHRAEGEDGPREEWTTRRELARHLTVAGELREAAEQWRWLIEHGRQRGADPHGAERVHHLNLAWVLLEDGRFAEAEAALAPLAGSLSPGGGGSHLEAFARVGLACGLLARGECAAAASILHRATPSLERTLGSDARRTQIALWALREALHRCGDVEAAAIAEARLIDPPPPSVSRLDAALRLALNDR